MDQCQSFVLNNYFNEQQNHYGFNGNLSLPVGYRFEPFDEQLIIYYLSPKVAKKSIPANLITEVDVYQYDPMKLSETYMPQGEGKWYFFSSRVRRYKNGSRPSRAAGEGYWKASGGEKEITYNDSTVGYKMSMVYYKGKPPNGEKTNWLMHEYTLHNAPQRQRSGPDDMKLDDVVLCKIYETKYNSSSRKRKSCASEDGNEMLQPIDQNNAGAGFVAITGQENSMGLIPYSQSELSSQLQNLNVNHQEGVHNYQSSKTESK